MIFYHADTHKHLHVGQILYLNKARTPIGYLYPYGVSSFGERAFLKPQTIEQQNMQIIDTVFDYVRAIRFPDKPSRFTSVYAALTPEDSKSWLEIISQDFDTNTDGCSDSSISHIPIYAVECDSAYIADSRFLDCGSVLQDTPLSFPALFPYAIAYWDSVQELGGLPLLSDSLIYPKYELLLVPPVRVVERIFP